MFGQEGEASWDWSKQHLTVRRVTDRSGLGPPSIIPQNPGQWVPDVNPVCGLLAGHECLQVVTA